MVAPRRPTAPRALLLMGQLTAGGRQFHNQPEHWSCLAAILRTADLAAATITDDLSALTIPNLARFDVVLNFSTDLVATSDQIDALVDAVAAGTGFVGLHAATATFRDSRPYVEMVGSRFARHPPIKRFTVEIVNPSHPVTAGIEPFAIEDERYELTEEAEDLEVLARAEGFTSIYARQHGNGRVCYLAPGHDSRTLTHPAYARLVHQAIAWTVRTTSDLA